MHGYSWGNTMDVALEHGLSSSDDCQLILVTPNTLALFWEQVEPLLEVGREHWEEYETIESLLASILASKRDLWLALDDGGVFLAMITEVVTYTKQQTLRIRWIGGSNLKKAFEFLDFIELMCARRGIKTIEVLGRLGWLRLLEGKGYEYRATLLVKDISGLKEH